MIKIVDRNKCCGCSACASICPKNCITMTPDKEGFLYPQLNKDLCLDCGLCENICPTNSPKDDNPKDIKIYAAINNNLKIRKESSSGGVFTAIAQYVIQEGGVVFGATFDENFLVVHSYVENSEDLAKFRGSKYVQSDLGCSFNQVKSFLDAGRLVFFSGTTCQVYGLLKFLRKEYDNLITQDIICHGVPSPKVWERYLHYICKGNTSKSISFRSKLDGWKNFSITIEKQDKYYKTSHRRDLYMQAFLSDLSLRPACYECKFKKVFRKSDFTLADFWGIENILPELDDDLGTSLVFVNTNKGNKIFNIINSNLTTKEVDLNIAIKYNPAMIKSVNCPQNRDVFMKEILCGNFPKVMKRYCKVSITKRIRTFMSRVKNKILRKD